MATATSSPSEVDLTPTETPSEFVSRTGLGVDAAWRAWNELEDREHFSRDAFRREVRS